MKTSTITSLLAVLAAQGLAAPTEYPPPKGGWGSVKYPEGTGANLEHYPPPKGGWESVKYPHGTGANLEHYPPPKGGWESVKYPSPSYNTPACKNGPFTFTSTYHITATPNQVVDANNTLTGGLPGAIGYYSFGINSYQDLICWNITLVGFKGEYQSPARTATHVHEAVKGKSGPPRIAFPNPSGNGHERYSFGCMAGPFITGVNASGVDTGAGFKVKQIEDNPAGFFADVHSSLAVPGAVRGQLA